MAKFRKRKPEEKAAAKDAEHVLVAALQESDTAVEAIQDAELDARKGVRYRRASFTAAGLLLAVCGFVLARRRKD